MLHVDHECDIPSKQEDILFLPGRGPGRKLMDALRQSLMASHKVAGARKHLRSHASITAEKRRHLRNYRSIIHPFSGFRLWWDVTIIFVITALLLSIPYQAAFDTTPEPNVWTFFKNLLLLVCCADMVVNFRTGYFNEDQRVVVMEQRGIITRYVRHGTFVPDLFSSLPTDLFFITAWNEWIVARRMASLVCFFRVFSLNSYLGKIAYAYSTPRNLYEFCLIIFWLLLALHWQSCLYWCVPFATTSMRQPERPTNDSWMHATGLWESSRGQQYLSCFSRAVATFLRSGFLLADPRNTADIYMVILLQILGALTSWLLLARVMQFFKGVNSSTLRYQTAVAQLKQYMRHMQLPHETQKRIMTYYEFRFQRQYFLEGEITQTLSMRMRQEINMHLCRKLVENVTFFNNLPFPLLTRIVALLKSEVFLTNDVIVRANQPGNCMYFIGSGTVAVYTMSGKEVCHLEDGAHFGEVALVMPEARRVASVVAIEACELYRLDRVDFSRTIQPYPMLWEQIKNIAIERHEKTMILNAQ